MLKTKLFFIIIFLFCLIIPSKIFSQEVNIVPYLKQIESGNKEAAESALKDLKKDHPDDPSVMFLDGVLTENAQDAVAIYKEILDKSPGSKYADAALYRIYSYYYALGLYNTASQYLNRLKVDYPSSPYIKIAERNIPSKDESDSEEGNDKKDDSAQTNNQKLPAAAKYLYTIQAGAFSNESNAAELNKDFKDSGFYSEIKEKNIAGTTFHVVYVGRFENVDEAQNFLQVINKEFKLDGRVVNIEN